MSLLSSWRRLASPTPKIDPCPCPSHDDLAIIEKADVLNSQLADSRADKVQRLVHTIVETHSDLLKLDHFRPGNPINQLLGNLVSVCSEIYDRDIVDQVCMPRRHEDPTSWTCARTNPTSFPSRSSPTLVFKLSSPLSVRSAPRPSPASSYTGPTTSCRARPRTQRMSSPAYTPFPTMKTTKSSPAWSCAPSSPPPRPHPDASPLSGRVRCP